MQARKLLVCAAAASALYWGFGQLCLLPYYLAPFAIAPQVVGWVAVAIALPTVGGLTWAYLRWLGKQAGYPAAWFLSLALAGIHIPADYLFISAMLPELLPVQREFGPLIYTSFGFVPPLTAALFLRRRGPVRAC